MRTTGGSAAQPWAVGSRGASSPTFAARVHDVPGAVRCGESRSKLIAQVDSAFELNFDRYSGVSGAGAAGPVLRRHVGALGVHLFRESLTACGGGFGTTSPARSVRVVPGPAGRRSSVACQRGRILVDDVTRESLASAGGRARACPRDMPNRA